MKPILTVGLSPGLQKTIVFAELRIGEVNRSDSYRLDAGGKSVNVARALNQLEAASAWALVPVGSENRDLFRSLCERDGIHLIEVPVEGRVRHCYTLVDRSAGGATELVVDEPEPALPQDSAAVTRRFQELIGQVRAVILAGSRPSGFDHAVYPQMVIDAARSGVPVIADYRGADLRASLQSSSVRPDVIKINEHEFRTTFGAETGEEELRESLRELSSQHGNIVVVTRGERGTCVARSGELFECPVETVAAVNQVGCGDAFTAGFTRSWLDGGVFLAAVEEGNRCAAAAALTLPPGSIRERVPEHG
jgi:1-phosphofructokinase family hexose kinase